MAPFGVFVVGTSRAICRQGAVRGKERAVHETEKDQPMWGVSLGFGFPMRPPSYTNQYSIINTSFEFGKRGNNSNEINENFFKIGIGLTLSDIWFIKRKYE